MRGSGQRGKDNFKGLSFLFQLGYIFQIMVKQFFKLGIKRLKYEFVQNIIDLVYNSIVIFFCLELLKEFLYLDVYMWKVKM